jgi:ribosome maturation factor RimP
LFVLNVFGVIIATDLTELLRRTLAGLGCELVDMERSHSGQIRVFIDKPQGITVDDCAAVSNQLTRLFAVEGVDYGRLEVSSPGLDRPLKSLADYSRFAGHKAKVKLLGTLLGRKRFVGTIGKVAGEKISFMVEDGGKDSVEMTLALSEIERARLVPEI